MDREAVLLGTKIRSSVVNLRARPF